MDNQDLKKKIDTSVSKNRRSFLKSSGVLAGAALAATALPKREISAATGLDDVRPSWSKYTGEAVTNEHYGSPIEFENNVLRRRVDWLTASPIASINFTPHQDLYGIITPSGLHFERHHGGAPTIDPKDYRLMVNGMVDREMVFTYEDILKMPSVTRIHFLECPANGGMEWRGTQMETVQFTHGMVSCSEWTGVRLKDLLAETGLSKDARWMLAEGSDAAMMTRSIPIEKVLDDAMLAFAQNGEKIRKEQGYPIRLLLPGFEGNMQVKWLRRLEFAKEPWMHREETSKYTDLMADGKARKFTWLMESNSVITRPSGGMKIKPGYVEITGIAWSGKGRIEHVDISLDGGKNWKEAQIVSPKYDKALTRFKFDWQFDGKKVYDIQSRSIDSTGYVQPQLNQLRKERGVSSIYHKNSIHNWRVYEDGQVTNYQI